MNLKCCTTSFLQPSIKQLQLLPPPPLFHRYLNNLPFYSNIRTTKHHSDLQPPTPIRNLTSRPKNMNDPRRALPLSSRHSALNSEQYATNSRSFPGQSPNGPHTNRGNPFSKGNQPLLSGPVVGARMPSRLDNPQLQAYDPKRTIGSRMASRLDNPESQSQSTLKTSYDVKMATRQLQIESLSSTEKHEQDKWAQSQLSLHSTCVMGMKWLKNVVGYRCSGGGHLVTNELLAEGKGGLYHHCNGVWLGPM